MGEPQFQFQSQSQSSASSPPLPPGCRFYPSEEHLLRYYLTNKNNDGDFHGGNLISELNLYRHDPFELPGIAGFSYGYRGRKRHWYCYTVRVLNDARRRKVESDRGYWLRQGRARDVFGSGGNAVLGTRTSFAFYLANSPKNAVRTDWMLYEYALVDHPLASFVLCRVFLKPRHKNSASEIGLSSCAEESASAVRHIGIQHDEYVTPSVVDAKVCDDSSIDRKNEISVHPLRCTTELDDHQVMTAPVSVANFQCSACLQGRFSGLPGGNAMFVEAATSEQHLLSILEEDFIELDDLV